MPSSLVTLVPVWAPPGSPSVQEVGEDQLPGPGGPKGLAQSPHLHVAPIDVHAADHAALRGDICPVDHLLPIVEIQSHRIVQPLGGREKCGNSLIC